MHRFHPLFAAQHGQFFEIKRGRYGQQADDDGLLAAAQHQGFKHHLRVNAQALCGGDAREVILVIFIGQHFIGHMRLLKQAHGVCFGLRHGYFSASQLGERERLAAS